MENDPVGLLSSPKKIENTIVRNPRVFPQTDLLRAFDGKVILGMNMTF
jgi:hypothetical protein